MVIATGRGDYPLGHHHHRRGSGNYRYWIIAMLRYGTARVESGGREFQINPNAVTLIEPEVDYRIFCGNEVHPETGDSYVIFMPRRSWLHLLAWPQLSHGYMRTFLQVEPTRKLVTELLAKIHDYFHSSLPERKMFADNALERLLLELNLVNPVAEHANVDGRIRDVMAFVCKNFQKPLSVENMAKRANMSPSRFAHLFKEEIGLTPRRFLEEQRLESAQQRLISSNRSIACIAEECGYRNCFHFSTRFRKMYGRSPKEYRDNPGGV